MTRGMFLTVFYGILDSVKNTLEFVSAAHNETIIFRKKSGKAELLAPEGFPAGIGSGPEMLKERLKAVKVSIEPGDRIIVYTDGIFEAMNEKRSQLGMEKFTDIIEKNSGKNTLELKEAVISAVTEFTNGTEQSDDMALLIIERTV
jgi:sigma-B regulation protein RsbU (phosphoserine phosphatase)